MDSMQINVEKTPYLLFLCCWIALPHFASCVSVRLVSNLNHSFEGRVEVHYNGEWGTVCNTNWDMNDANVVCRTLGYQRALAISYKFGQGSGRIWLDHVTCFGPESSIDRCCHRGWGIHNCTHQQDAGVICLPRAAHTDVKVRLTNTNISHAGRVEVRYYGAWKPICDYSWDKWDSNVVCRMMGYKRGAAGVLRRLPGSGNVWLTGVYCRGYETSIQNCSHSTWGRWSCSDNRLAGVVCISGNSTLNITFRLTNSIIPNEGRLEMRYYGIWGTVCTYFDQRDAHVVCRMMGYSQAALIYKQPHTNGMYRFSLSMHCNGQESSIQQCGYYMGYINDCANWDVWIVCKSSVHSSNVTVRLVNGTTPNKGRVEVGYRGTWGTICSFYWTLRDARVVCRMLNYSKALWTGTTRVKGSGPIFVFGNCRGNEKSLQYCNTYQWYWYYCNHNSDVQVTCDNMTKEENSSVAVVRLVGYDNNNTGSVEVIYNGMWTPICDDYRWDMLGAHVVCRMLGYKGALRLLRQYRMRNSKMWIAGVACSGNEVSISECYTYSSTTGWCSGAYQAGVLCEVKDSAPIQVRLEDGNSPGSGRVTLRYGNIWGNLCAWSGVDMNDAKVICRMLGYPGASRVTYMYSYGIANKTIWLNNLQCNGTEKTITDCSRPRVRQRCHYSYYFSAVVCRKVDAPQFQIRGTNDVTDSTVEIVFNVSQSLGTQLQNLPFSVYQVVVKLRETEHSSKSHERPGPLTIKEVDYRTALEQGHDSYVAAEILGPNIVPTLTIGDGKYYRGYFNAPLNAEHNYRIYVRVVTKSYYGKRVYGDSAFVSFMTKPKADAPQFRINGKDSITASSVEILLNGRQKRETAKPTRVYQVAVEKKENERFFSSYDPTTLFIFREVNLTMAVKHKYENYLTAEVQSSVSRLTIGDGQYYHGYYNAPLDPGYNYKIHVRTVKRSADGKQFYGHSSWVAFTTKQSGKPNAGKTTGEGNEKATVIGLSVVIVVLILLVIGVIVWFVVKKRRASEDDSTNEMSEIQARSNPLAQSPEFLYENLSFPSLTQDMGGFSNPVYNMSEKKKKKKGKKSENEAPESVPRGQVNGHDKQEQAYHVSDIRPQNPDEYKMDGNLNENATC